MSILARPPSLPEPAGDTPVPLEAGDHLDRKTFHERYEAMGTDRKFELIEGIVYMPSPVYLRHSRPHGKVIFWLELYEVATPGVEAADNTSVILDETSEPQPDASLFIRREHGGQTPVDEDCLVGAPELVVEIANSSASYDLHSKKRVYERAGVREYVVVLIREARVVWFALGPSGYEEQSPGVDGIFRSEVFPGLWLDPAALIRLDGKAIQAALQKGLATDEHRAYCERLSRAEEETDEK